MGSTLIQYLKNISNQTRSRLIFSLILIMFLGGGYGCNDDSITSDPMKLPSDAPPTPMNLMIQPGNGEITLTWDAVRDASNYKVYRDDSLIADDVMGTTYRDTGLTNGQEYSYQVSTVKDGAESKRSAEVQGIPSMGSPPTPTNLMSQPGDRAITLTWNMIEDASYYKVYRDGSQVGGNVTGTTYTDTGLTNGQEYRYQVSAVRDGAESERSVEVQGIPLPDAPPAPMNLRGQPGNQQITLTWDMVTGASYYRVYRNNSRIANNIRGTMYTNTGLTNDTSYSYQVSAVIDAGSCSSCQVESLRTRGTNVTPVVPVAGVPAVTIQSMGSGQLTLRWNMIDGASHYKVYRGGSQVGGNVTGTTYTNTGLTNGTSYSYQVSAVIGGTEGTRSAAVQGIPLPDAPSAPMNLMSQPGNQQITLTWGMVTGASYYRVYRDDSQIANNATGTTYTDTGLTNGTSYSYQVSAVINVGSCSSCQVEGPRSDSLSTIPSLPRPVAPVTVLKSGAFSSSGGYTVSGGGSIVRDSNNKLFAILGSNFSTTPGPDLYVYLSQAMSVTSTNFLDLGILRANSGEQFYAIPSGTDVSSYTHIVIYCKQFSVLFGRASLSAPSTLPAPMNLMGQPGNQEITLTWDAVTGASYYRVYRGSSRVANNITGTTYKDTGLTNGTSYSYQVSAVRNVGSCSLCQLEGARSASLSVAPSNEPVAPVTVLKSGAFSSSGGYTVSGGGSIVRDSNNKLFAILGSNFSSSTGPGLYVYLSQAMSVTSNNFLNLGGLRQNSGEQFYAIPSGTDVSSYTHIVIYCKPASVTFGTASLSAPSTLPAPMNLMGQPGNQEITLTWDAVTGASYYRVYRGSSRIANNITGTTYKDTGLTNGTSYSYQVSAVRNVGSCSLCPSEGARSASLSVAPSNEPVGSVTVLKSGNFTNALYSPVSGGGSIVRDSNNNLFVTLGTDFTTPSGPDLNVYISQGYKDRSITNFLDLGDLRSTTGEQSYAIPSGTDIAPYTHIVIYCVGANGAFGKAAVSTP